MERHGRRGQDYSVRVRLGVVRFGNAGKALSGRLRYGVE